MALSVGTVIKITFEIWYNKFHYKILGITVWSMDSTYMSFYLDGKVSDSLFFVKNNQIGNEVHYYENGQVAYKVEYKNDKLHQIHNYFDKNGIPLDVGTFKNGGSTLFLVGKLILSLREKSYDTRRII